MRSRCSGATTGTSSSPMRLSPPTMAGGAMAPPQTDAAAYPGSHHSGLSSPYASATCRKASSLGTK